MILDVNSPDAFLLCILIFFVAILFRYFLTAGIFYYYYFVANPNKFSPQRLSRRQLKRGQLKKEIFYSIESSAIFALIAAGTYLLWQNGMTAIYLDISVYGYWYLPVSLILILFLHETYYYWIHRWMHIPKIFRKVHKVHHDSLIPTPWTAFSFHPYECLLEAVILPVILLMVPVHPLILGFYLLIMTVSSVINHLDIEVYPQGFRKSRLGRLFIGATHHHHHHSEFVTNYGLYFTFWDKWMGTESNKMKPVRLAKVENQRL